MEIHHVELLELRLLSGFLRDRHLLTLASNEGFHVDLLVSMQARRLAKAIIECHNPNRAILDGAVLREHIADRGLLTPEMEQYLVSVLQTSPISAGDMVEQVEALKARESREMLLHVHEALSGFLYGPERVKGDIVQITTDAIARLREIQHRRQRRQISPISETLGPMLSTSPIPPANGLLGYSIHPFNRLNTLLSGVRRGFYYGLAGAPRRGKTNFALDLATHIATNHRIPVLFYTWEQTRRVLAARLIAKETGLDPTAVLMGRNGDGSPIGERVFAAQGAVGRFAPYLHLVEAGRKDTVDRIRSHAYNLMQEFQTQDVVLFFDYLQKIPLTEHMDDWKARTDLISTELAELSLELNCPVFAISPLDKEGCRLDEKPADESEIFNLYNRPTMHHSMGSGDLEYDLDVALVLAKDWKATHDLRQLTETRASAEGIDVSQLPAVDVLNLFVDKNRDAPEGASNTVQYAFFVTQNKLLELDYKLDLEYRPDFHGFSKLQEIYTYLRDHGFGPPREPAVAVRKGRSGGVVR